MIRNIFYAVYFFLVVFLTQFFPVLPFFLLRLVGAHGAARFLIKTAGRFVHRMVVWGTGSKVEVIGEENLPGNTERLCIISNHQSYFDTPIIFGFLPYAAGFIAKKEIKKVPMLNWWTIAVGSIFIDRKNARSAVESISRGVEMIKAGQPLAIFPEGTRSKSSRMTRFKAGSLKLALRSGAVIVPLTVRDSYKIFEETGRITPTKVTLVVHPPVETAGLREEERRELAEKLEGIVRNS